MRNGHFQRLFSIATLRIIFSVIQVHIIRRKRRAMNIIRPHPHRPRGKHFIDQFLIKGLRNCLKWAIATVPQRTKNLNSEEKYRSTERDSIACEPPRHSVLSRGCYEFLLVAWLAAKTTLQKDGHRCDCRSRDRVPQFLWFILESTSSPILATFLLRLTYRKLPENGRRSGPRNPEIIFLQKEYPACGNNVFHRRN